MARVNLNRAAIARVVGAKSKAAARRAAEATRDRTRANIVRSGRVGTGAMAASIVMRDVTVDPLRPTFEVGPKRGSRATRYFRYQEQGTQAHGPVTAQALRFRPRGSRVFIFRKWVRGVVAGHFLRRATRSIRARDYLPR